MPPPNRYSCVNCARRKVKCDRLSPCSGCSRTQSACTYRAPAPSQRHRKQLTHGDLLSRIRDLETLLRSHGIVFNPLDNSWITSPLEEMLLASPQVTSPSSGSFVETPLVVEAHPVERDPEGPSRHAVPGEQCGAARLWSELSEDLKTPQVSQLKRPSKDEEEQSTRTDTSSVAISSIWIPSHLSTGPGQLELHPNPKHVFKLWQTFADRVNPLIKIVHAPTLQEKIFEAAWAVESATKPLEAMMFAVYALAVASMKPADCMQTFGESRPVLVSRYRTGALRALHSADLLLTRDLEVLQAFALTLLIDPQSEFSKTAVTLAVRIGHKMGLHRTGEDPHVPFFEQEMRLRLWWHIRGLNSRVRRSMGLSSAIHDLGDVRMPMNLNDADLHPRMVKPAVVQHTATTEMLYCLMKYDLWNFLRKSPDFSDSCCPKEKALQLIISTNVDGMAKKKRLMSQVESMFQDKYLGHLDPNIPLHHISAAMTNLTIHRLRFWCFHPRHQPEGGRSMSQADQDVVFESGVRVLELDHDVRNTSFSVKLVEHMSLRTQVDALVYVVSELRRRANGRLVKTAWALVEEIYDEHPVLLQDDHKFYTALADLILEAWDTRWRALELQAEAAPRFIKKLQAARGKVAAANGPTADLGGVQDGFMRDFIHDEPVDWDGWDEFLQL